MDLRWAEGIVAKTAVWVVQTFSEKFKRASVHLSACQATFMRILQRPSMVSRISSTLPHVMLTTAALGDRHGSLTCQPEWWIERPWLPTCRS
mmetsp:Transcript_123427/g.320627  ORF Transcript_123427/g.320627 Transcript_123427/m.320627 type:complete len:92 (-) Transcript_123427:9-284(-)